MEGQDHIEDFGDHDQLPIGYRFVPTDEELVNHYFINKVFCNPLPASTFHEIHATKFYSMPPKSLVEFASDERQWFFFIDDDEKNKGIRRVGDGVGFWHSNGDDEKPILDPNGFVLAFKLHFIYFSGTLSNPKKTHWSMDEYRLPKQFYSLHNLKEEWAVGRLKRGRDYNFGF
ncbi:No apical meristem (NAM) protein [Corchorus olitorius]|uniref:No apical meristem (NAM) protein n=1 Tax=Corchorus olitorius TaxID=93759 RepID=A0A1R3GMG1_9ROSI|nr:No apical meristem (NAM) protein [Corchorus olitorius]